jgi:hypothetical protein
MLVGCMAHIAKLLEGSQLVLYASLVFFRVVI